MINLGDVLRGEHVPELDTIQRIDIDMISDDPRNFYDLSDLDELAANIEMLGLQQPLRVRDDPDTHGHYIIVSGHRRRAAIRKLVEDGRKDLRLIPCIREQTSGSEAMQELRLIFANSDTRKLSPAEISRQAERVEALLYQLQAEGVKFPGRMRDHVAEACKVSKSKLARLKVIREKLISNLQPTWAEGKIPESVAYCLAQESAELQMQFAREWGHQLGSMTELLVKTAIDIIKYPPQMPTAPRTESAAQKEVAEYMAERAEEEKRFYYAMSKYGFKWLLTRETAEAKTRRDGIEALKRMGREYRGGAAPGYVISCEPKGFRIQLDHQKEISRTWTETWDTMAAIAMRKAVEHGKA